MRIEIICLSNYADFSNTGKLNINGIFDEIFADSIPTNLNRGYLVFTFSGAEINQQEEFKVKITNPIHEIIFENKITLETGRAGKGSFVAEISGLPLKAEGEFTLTVENNYQKIGETTLRLRKVVKDGKETPKSGVSGNSS